MNMASMLLPASPPKAKIAELGLILQQQTQLPDVAGQEFCLQWQQGVHSAANCREDSLLGGDKPAAIKTILAGGLHSDLFCLQQWVQPECAIRDCCARMMSIVNVWTKRSCADGLCCLAVDACQQPLAARMLTLNPVSLDREL